MASYNDKFKTDKANWVQPFERTGGFPLDRSSMFSSLADATAYAKGEKDARGLSKTSYVGQIITVYENSNVDVYKITEGKDGSKGLEKVGNGLGSITADNYSAAKTLAKADNVGLVVYVLTSETVKEPAEGPDSKEVTYSAGPYIVTGLNSLSKLGTTSASGDISGDVETLKTDVSNLKTNKVESVNVPGTLAPGSDEKTPLPEAAKLTGKDITITYDSVLNENSVNALLNKAVHKAFKDLEGMISNVPKFKAVVVKELPKAEIDLQAIYFIPAGPGVEEKGNMYDEYIYLYDSLTPEGIPVGGRWEKLGTQKLVLAGYATKAEARLTDIGHTEELLNSIFTKKWKESIDAAVTANAAAISKETENRTAANEALSNRIKTLEDTNIATDFAGVKTKAEAADTLSRANKSEIDALTSSLAGTEAKADRADKAAVANTESIEGLTTNLAATETKADRADKAAVANTESISSINSTISDYSTVKANASAADTLSKANKSEIDTLTNTVNEFDKTYVKQADKISDGEIDKIVTGQYPETK